jgi:predicted O-methyltransferase YrrM
MGNLSFIEPEIEAYSEQHSSSETELLSRIREETIALPNVPNMLSSPFQGRILSMLSHMMRPKAILELGTFTGYSALCLAEGLAPDGKLTTVDHDPRLRERVEGYFAESPLGEKIEYITARALTILHKLPRDFDLIFIDADKENYEHYFRIGISMLRQGGLIIADNVLWGGKVLHEAEKNATRYMQQYNKLVASDARVEQILLPLRDGLMLARKL